MVDSGPIGLALERTPPTAWSTAGTVNWNIITTRLSAVLHSIEASEPVLDANDTAYSNMDQPIRLVSHGVQHSLLHEYRYFGVMPMIVVHTGCLHCEQQAATQPNWSYTDSLSEEQMEPSQPRWACPKPRLSNIMRRPTEPLILHPQCRSQSVWPCHDRELHLLLEQGLVTPGPYQMWTRPAWQIHCENNTGGHEPKPTPVRSTLSPGLWLPASESPRRKS